MAPVFAHGQLRLYLLSLLASGPKHGYELITALSDRFGGTYRPSAGTVYPRLARLEEEGLVRRVDDGRKSTYSLTDAGRQELAVRSADLAALEEDLAETVRGRAAAVREDVRGSMAGLRADLAARGLAGAGALGATAGTGGGRGALGLAGVVGRLMAGASSEVSSRNSGAAGTERVAGLVSRAAGAGSRLMSTSRSRVLEVMSETSSRKSRRSSRSSKRGRAT